MRDFQGANALLVSSWQTRMSEQSGQPEEAKLAQGLMMIELWTSGVLKDGAVVALFPPLSGYGY